MKKYLDTSLSAQERAEALVDEMTVEEMASQLRYDAPAIERLGINAYNWWNEGIHGLARSGVATMFPQAIGLAAMFDTELTGKAAEVTSDEARAKYNAYQRHGDYDIYKGLTLWAPNINIFRDPRWGRGHETYGEDPFLTAELGKAYVKGLQGDGKVMKVAACAKHFAVHSGPESLRHFFDAKADAKDMEETYLPAFEALVKGAKVESVMGAYNRVNGEPACASDFLMDKLKEWEFDGYFVSDCWAIRDFHENHKVTAGPVESAAMALKAGCDVNCGCTYVNLLAALSQGLISEEDIRKACVHLMRTRIRLGMFDGHTEFDDIPYSSVASKEHKAYSLDCARRSMVLLKNNGILPIDESKYKTIAVIGPNSDSRIALEGNYNGLSDRYTTFLTGIQDRFSGRVIYAEGCHLYKSKVSVLAQDGDRYAEALAAAESADLVVMCVGLDSTIEGEEGDTGNEFSSGDKNGLLLPAPQGELVKKIMALNKPTVIVVSAGSAINTCADPDALLHVWYPGAEGGKALAEILFGDVSPSGKLPVTFYEDTEKLPEFTDYSMKGRTYRYASENILFPFGYGLTYGDVRVRRAELVKTEDSTAENGAADRIRVTYDNDSAVDTKDVIQVYVEPEDSPWKTPNPRLCGFLKISAPAGKTCECEVILDKDTFKVVNDEGERVSGGDHYKLYIGTSMPDKKSITLTGKEPLVLNA